MITEIQVTNENNPLDPNTIKIDVPNGTKILSNESYVKDLYDAYMGQTSVLDYSEPQAGETVTATISNIHDNQAALSVNGKHTVFLNIDKEDSAYKDYLQIGSELKVKLHKNKNDKSLGASFTDAVKENKFVEILESIGKPVAYKAHIDELIHGGYYLTIDGIRTFMPGSLVGMNKVWDFETFVGQDIIVMPINYSKDKGTIVVSRRAYLTTLLPSEVNKIKENMSQKYTGFVTGCSKYGVFVEFNECVTGLIPMAELDDATLKLFNERSIKPGDKIGFMTKDVINDRKIILTQKEENTWIGIEKKFKPMSKVQGKVNKVTKYGIFIEIDEGIVGLLHASEYKRGAYKEDDTLEVIIQKIDIDNKQIAFSLPKN